jgi:glycosyltransferase involved in cell wall biosynthesis
MEPQKDPQLALKVIQALGGAHLTMLGEGALRDSIQNQVAALGLSDRVTLVGHAPQIEPYLAAADALLITSRYEGGPAVAVEALASGVPVVSPDCSFLLHDLLAIPQAGKIVASREPRDLATALAAVCDQSRQPERLRALVTPFQPQACARAYLDWFDGLAHG